MLFEVGRIAMRNFQNIVILVFLALGEMDDFQCRSPSYYCFVGWCRILAEKGHLPPNDFPRADRNVLRLANCSEICRNLVEWGRTCGRRVTAARLKHQL
jgi:hypothetical protein